MLNDAYSLISPSISGDTTCLFMINSSTDNYSYIMKYLPGQGDISKSQLITSEMEEKFNNFITSDKTINPVAYMVYDELTEKYYLKIGRVDGVVGISKPVLLLMVLLKYNRLLIFTTSVVYFNTPYIHLIVNPFAS